MNHKFKHWLEIQMYLPVEMKNLEHTQPWNRYGWRVIDEKYNNGANPNWYNVVNKYRILERLRQLNK
jgi:hypothetical protein